MNRYRPETVNGIGPIPISEINAYAEIMGYQSLTERNRLLNAIRSMDAAYLKLRRAPNG